MFAFCENLLHIFKILHIGYCNDSKNVNALIIIQCGSVKFEEERRKLCVFSETYIGWSVLPSYLYFFVL